jgi:hypothetical protein
VVVVSFKGPDDKRSCIELAERRTMTRGKDKKNKKDANEDGMKHESEKHLFLNSDMYPRDLASFMLP